MPPAGQDEYDLRVDPLINVEPLLSVMGCQPETVIRAAGFDPGEFLDPERRIPYIKAARLFGLCAQATACDDFGLLLGQWFAPAQIGIAGKLAESAPDVGTALQDLVENFDLHDRGGLVSLDISSRFVSLGYAIKVQDAPAAAQVYDFCVTSICRTMRLLCGLDWNPHGVKLAHIEPGNTQPYTDYFRAPVQFDATESAVIFHRSWLKHPLVQTDPEHHAKLAAAAFRMRAAKPLSFRTRVQTIVYRRLARENTAAVAAALLRVHERTLHRRLQLEDTSFRRILDEARCVTCVYYLRATALPIKDIASALGYGGTDALDHAFRRWFGTAPSRWREEQARP